MSFKKYLSVMIMIMIMIMILSIALTGCAQKTYEPEIPKSTDKDYSSVYKAARELISSDLLTESEEILKGFEGKDEDKAKAMIEEIRVLKASKKSYEQAILLLESENFSEAYDTLMEISELDTRRYALVPKKAAAIRKAVMDKALYLKSSGDEDASIAMLVDYLGSDPGADSVHEFLASLDEIPEVSKPTETKPDDLDYRFVVTLDPGHQLVYSSTLEPIGPGSDVMKPRVTSGTMGTDTGIKEHELVLDLSLRVRALLVDKGIEVVMTRTSADVDLSNIDRAKIANDHASDLFVRIHANGADDRNIRGISAYYPGTANKWAGKLSGESRKASLLILEGIVGETGAKDRGARASDSYTGINWSEVPVVIVETGFMTNPEEDLLLATDEYRQKVAKGIAEGILKYLGF